MIWFNVEKDKDLEMQHKQLIADIKTIVGNKRFMFSDAFTKRYVPNIGIGDRPIGSVTKKYVYVSCFLQYGKNGDNTEYGAIIKKYPICYQRGCGSFVNKVELEDLFVSDLERIVSELRYYIWWEANVHFPAIKAEYEQTLPFIKQFNNLEEKLGHVIQFNNTTDESNC